MNYQPCDTLSQHLSKRNISEKIVDQVLSHITTCPVCHARLNARPTVQRQAKGGRLASVLSVTTNVAWAAVLIGYLILMSSGLWAWWTQSPKAGYIEFGAVLLFCGITLGLLLVGYERSQATRSDPYRDIHH